MLDKNALSQLKSLKQEIQQSTPRFEGTVRATAGRFGFVNTEDGQSFFLSPEEMEKVLPGDVVAFRVEPAGEGKEQAIVESLISTVQNEFLGRYVVRGKGHFVEADHPTLNRWIFVPPAKRLQAKDGDLVKAHISQHPFPKGKAQADLDAVIGNDQTPHIERLFVQQKFGLSDAISDAAQAQVDALCAQGVDTIANERSDLTHLPFVTIDSAGTRDIDDALYAEAQSNGWTLWIAIADPAALIEPGTPLDELAKTRATSAYFPDQVLPMLPPALSEQLCSLQAGELRLAMVVELRLSQDGDVRQTTLHNAIIKSRAKLTYNQVSHLIAGECDEIAAELQGPVLHLSDCAKALAANRLRNCLVMEDRPDFKLLVDEDGHVTDIVRIERNDAHRLVEECMLVCNRSVALWLKERNAGMFIEHAGVRSERIGEVAALLRENLALEAKPKFDNLEEYVQLMQQAAKAECELPLRAIIGRQQERSRFGLEGKPHMGLGFPCYTTFTSPLRKYNDLMIHRTVRALLNGENIEQASQELLDAVQQAQTSARIAANQTEQWMKLVWLNAKDKDAIYNATIVHMNSSSITVRLNDNGIEGTIDRRKVKGDWTFDSKTFTHRNAEQCFMLGQALNVRINEVRPYNRQVTFVIVE
ncbi:ribonuclease R family protein [Thalassolituus oleivorans]|uniref:ribonuclease R family protein n=1 Tax=Thalassolituus oleivorans TaxID=187493 RepID=UPI0023F04BA7|nr:ribonuclease R family protein [Thalassolituus oleivorans]